MTALRGGLVAFLALGLAGRAARGEGSPGQLFATSDQCAACHDGLVTRAGEDVSIDVAWRASIMANSARDPYWQAAVSREISDHPEVRAEIEDTCSTCHMPMHRFVENRLGRRGQVLSHLPFGRARSQDDRLAEDGVSCSLCHQIEDARLGTSQSYNGGFAVDTSVPPGQRREWGPFAVQLGLERVMESATGFRPAQSDHVRRSELCATCHTLYTDAYRGGRVVGHLPEQVPYLEWLHSDYRETLSCQDCHMPAPETPAPIASVLGPEHATFAQHTFLGGNFLVLGMLNRYRAELDVAALPGDLAAAQSGTVRFLQEKAARISVRPLRGERGRVQVEVEVENATGHKLPTAYPARRVWIHLAVRDARGHTVFESGRLREDGAIEGNDNDEDPRAFEPHHLRIDRPDQVQVYESILAAPDGTLTTGLTSADHYVKDNRLLPAGFDKRTAVADVAVRGEARDDPDFAAGGDRLVYSASTGSAPGPFRIEAELWYQPIGFRWAMNHAGYREAESQRFLSYYRAMSATNAVRLAAASAEVR